MKIKKIVFSLIILIILTLLGAFFYAFKVEPYRVVVNEHQLNVSKTKANLKIVQLSDLHIKKDFNANHLYKVIKKTKNKILILLFFQETYMIIILNIMKMRQSFPS